MTQYIPKQIFTFHFTIFTPEFPIIHCIVLFYEMAFYYNTVRLYIFLFYTFNQVNSIHMLISIYIIYIMDIKHTIFKYSYEDFSNGIFLMFYFWIICTYCFSNCHLLMWLFPNPLGGGGQVSKNPTDKARLRLPLYDICHGIFFKWYASRTDETSHCNCQWSNQIILT